MHGRPLEDTRVAVLGRFHGVVNDFSRLIEFERDGSVEAVSFHPDLGRHRRRGRFDGDGTIRFEDGARNRVEVDGLHLLLVDGHPHRRILDDGTVVGYPRTVTARFEGHGALVWLRDDGTLTHQVTSPRGAVAERGRYDLHHGFAQVEAWGRHRGILLLPDGDLLLGQDPYRRVPGNGPTRPGTT